MNGTDLFVSIKTYKLDMQARDILSSSLRIEKYMFKIRSTIVF